MSLPFRYSHGHRYSSSTNISFYHNVHLIQRRVYLLQRNMTLRNHTRPNRSLSAINTCFRCRRCDTCVIAATGRRKHTHTGRLIVYYAALSNNRRVSDQLGEYSRPCYRRQNPRVGHALLGQLTLFSESKHCSRRRRYTQVESTSPRKCADKTQIIARKRCHGARIY